MNGSIPVKSKAFGAKKYSFRTFDTRRINVSYGGKSVSIPPPHRTSRVGGARPPPPTCTFRHSPGGGGKVPSPRDEPRPLEGIGMAGAPNYLRGRVDDEQQVWELTEMHGLDEGRTVLLKSVPTLLRGRPVAAPAEALGGWRPGTSNNSLREPRAP